MGERSEIDVFARRQYGVFNRDQIRRAGFDRSAVKRRVASGEWIRLAPNMLCLASAAPRWERLMAAAVLSRRRAYVGGSSAAYLHGFRDYRQRQPTIIVPEGGNGRLPIGRVAGPTNGAEAGGRITMERTAGEGRDGALR